MPLEDLPDAVITRLRAQVAAFSNRVGGSSAEARASEDTELAVPHAFVLPAGTEEGEISLSDITQEMPIRFRVMIAVSNTSDARGQAGTSALLGLAASVMQALIGWHPLTNYAGCICEGIEDDFSSNRATLWGTVVFRTSAALSDL